MAFCPHCGAETDLVIPLAAVAAGGVGDDVEIARINAGRDIELAKLARRQEVDYNETRVAVAEIEAEAEVASAEATAEVVAAVIAGPDEPDDAPAPIVVDAGPPLEDEPDDAPPLNDDAPAPSSAGKPRGLGMW